VRRLDMYTDYEGYVATQTYRDTIRLAEREAARRWRFRHLKTPESKVLTAVITSVLALFVR
jgi:hypothetical protein